MTVQDSFKAVAEKLGLGDAELKGGDLPVHSPIDGSELASVKSHSVEQAGEQAALSVEAFNLWKQVPAPRRGELIRLFGEELRNNKEALGELVTLDCGKIFQEGLGEVQEMIDICDFAVGLSRQLYGLTIASERPGHQMRETWHPMGPLLVISAFNFPVAVWAWNTALALVCGDSVIWKPSEKTPLTAMACQKLMERAIEKFGDDAPANLCQLVIGDRDVGEALVEDRRIPLVSATGSCAMGRQVAPRVAERFGRSILELGGNNAIIVAPSADLDMAVRAILFGAVGTAGQRCTSTRRLFVHEDVYAELITALKAAYGKIRVGDPLDAGTLVGPLIDKASFEQMTLALARAEKEAAKIEGGERLSPSLSPSIAEAGDAEQAYYVQPALVEIAGEDSNVQEETFAPLLYVFKYKNLDNAIYRQNDVPQGLSSAIFTTDIREAEYFMSASGSDCGLANVNIGTSGAEIGGAFGGEKETGGGRESGSDAWRGYMRRQTSTVNYSTELPLAQGIEFEL